MLVAENVEKDRLIGQKSAHIADLTEEKQSLVAQIVEKDQQLVEKSATVAILTERNAQLLNEITTAPKEKGGIIKEKTTAINCLMVEKNRLLEAYLIELEKTKEMKLENEKLQQDLQSQKKQLERLLIKMQNNMLEIQSLEDLRAQVVLLRKELDEKEEVLQNLESDNQTLLIKELQSNRELQDSRRAATEGFEAMKNPQNRMVIGIKRMGEVDQKPFRDACLNKFHNSGDCEEKSIELRDSWQNHLSNPEWQPFRKETVNGELTEVIDEDDPMLKELRQHWGDEPYKAVVEALLGVNEYNASGRYPVSELWNYKDKRKATLAEVVRYVIKQWQTHKNKNKKIKNHT